MAGQNQARKDSRYIFFLTSSTAFTPLKLLPLLGDGSLQQSNDYQDEESGQSEVQGQAQAANGYALLDPRDRQHVLLTKDLKGNQQHPNTHFTPRKHPHAKSQTLANCGFATISS